ncbi:MAG: hypothetical protein VXW22_02000 [Pseudomonadota bacterium]|nr:hypothetical protein [Pseudomonadota bacterium]
MLHPSTRKLIDRLAEMTELGKLDWTEGEDNSVVYATEGYCVCLPDGANEIVITSKDGKELERASADELGATQSDSGTPYSQIVAGMAAEAARVARGTEAAISSLLAGMDDPVAEEAPEEPTESVAEPEDPGDEMAALADEVLPSVEPAAEAESQSADTSDTQPIDPTDAAENRLDVPAEIVDDANAENDSAESDDDVVEFSAAGEEEIEAPIATSDELDAPDSETDVTEAVARMADEVNNRQDQESEVDVAAAMAVGAVASAAGLDQTDDVDQTPETPEADQADEAPIEVAATQATQPPAYVPFGLEDSDAPMVADNDVVEAASDEPQSDADEASNEPADPTEPSAPVFVAAAPEVADDAAQADLDPAAGLASEATESGGWQHAVDDAPSDPVSSTEEQAEIVDIAHLAETPAESANDANVAAVDATPEQPQSYSLSGIGAGFGLGALSARTEASGIPGPSSPANAEPEKIVIDATEDVLPEIEGELNLPPLETSGSDDNVRSIDTADSASDSEADDSDGDILKPRTRFNPWD